MPVISVIHAPINFIVWLLFVKDKNDPEAIPFQVLRVPVTLFYNAYML